MPHRKISTQLCRVAQLTNLSSTFGPFCGPKGQESIAQALAWGYLKKRNRPVGRENAIVFLVLQTADMPHRKISNQFCRVAQLTNLSSMFGPFCGPKGHESIAQALAWGYPKKRDSPVGAEET